MKKKWFFTSLKDNICFNKIKTALLVCVMFCNKNICFADENKPAEEDVNKLLEKSIIEGSAVVDEEKNETNKQEVTDNTIKPDVSKDDKIDKSMSAVSAEADSKQIASNNDATQAVLAEIATIKEGSMQEKIDNKTKSDVTAPIGKTTDGVVKDIVVNNIIPPIVGEKDKNIVIKDNKEKTIEQKKVIGNGDVDVTDKKIADSGGVAINNKEADVDSNMTKIAPLDTKDIVIDEKVLKKVDEQIANIDKKQELEKQKEESEKKEQEPIKETNELNKTGKEKPAEVRIPIVIEAADAKVDEEANKEKPEQQKKGEDKKANENTQKDDKTKKITGIDFEKLFTTFNTKQALKHNFNDLNAHYFGFLENANEMKLIRRIIIEQKNPELKREREEKEKQSTLLQRQQQVLKTTFKSSISDIMRVASLVYFNNDNWRARVGGRVISNKDKTLKNVAVVKVNKTSIAFLLKKTSSQLVEQVKKIRKEGGSYSNNYYLIPDGKKTYIAFKLFIGQKIDLNTLKISG